jgi:SAM-dependent methyltransferase
MAFYSEKFYAGIGPGSQSSAQVVLPIVFELLQPRRVVDIGCGAGTWLAVCHELGAQRIFGVDGKWVTSNSLQIPVESFQGADLCEPLRLPEAYDLVISVEVAEHLPKARAESFVADLVRLGKAVLFSGAVPRQGGDRHINEQWQDYWARLFAKHDYAAIDCVRPVVWSNPRVDYWYAQNVLLYVSMDLLESNAGLRWAHDRTNLGQLSIVHPQLFTMRSRRSKFKQWLAPYADKAKLLRDRLRGRQ